MKFKVDTFTTAQAEAKPGRQNEDTLIVEENEHVLVAAVFDGATSIASVTGSSEKAISGRLAAFTAEEGVRKYFSTARNARELAELANKEIARELAKQGVNADSVSPLDVSQASGTIVRIDKQNWKLQVAQVGDTIGLIVYESGEVRKAFQPDPEQYDEDAIELAQELAKESGITLREAFIHPDISPKVEELMINSRLCDNTPSVSRPGCGVFNGNPRMQKYLHDRNFGISEIDQVLLLSDGLWLPTVRFDIEPDWKAMIQLIEEGGLETLYTTVLALKNSDPNFELYPRWKKHDDATGIRLQFI